MNRVQLLLIAIVFTAIAGKVNLMPVQKADYAALSTETKQEHIHQFFKYKVNHIQSEVPFRVKSCTIERAVCCHT